LAAGSEPVDLAAPRASALAAGKRRPTGETPHGAGADTDLPGAVVAVAAGGNQQANASPPADAAARAAKEGGVSAESGAAPASGGAGSPGSPGPAAAADGRRPQDWQQSLQAAINALESANREPPQSQSEVGRHAALRMLYLLAGRKDDALRPIAGIAPSQQDFWSQEVYGLATVLDTDRNPETNRRSAEAVERLRDATSRLSEHATLAVKNLGLCTEVASFGVYKPFDKLEFKAGQEALLYAEVDNFKSVRGEKGYRTALRSSYQILDSHGARVDSQEFDVTEEHCQNQRRDFFMRYHIWIPKRIYGGRYTLQLTIEDTLSQKIGQSSIEFDVKE
jgi:hypothetical protein